MSEEKLSIYSTSDIYFASYLCSVEIEMVSTEEEMGDDGRTKLKFVFKVSSSNVRRLRASYFAGHGTVKVRKFVDNLKALKSMVYT